MPTELQNRPVGIFDSGIGGLSVARHIMERLPGENTLYFGDSARVPYGSKSDETVRLYTEQAVRMLEQRRVKLIAIACNSASAVGLEAAQEIATVPVVGVISPGASTAVELTRSGVVGIIGTAATIRSGAYGRAIRALDPEIVVHSRACPLLVGFAEEGMVDHPATRLIVEEYVAPLLQRRIDTLILGCTHYPILREAIASVVGDEVRLVDPGEATAREVEDILMQRGMRNESAGPADHAYVLSDLPHRFIEVGESFLGSSIGAVEKISVESLSEHA